MKLKIYSDIVPKIRRITLCIYSDFNAGRCIDNAAALTVTTLLSLVPLITLLYAALRLMPGMNELGGQIENWLFQQLVPSRGDEIRNALQQFSGQASNLTIAGSSMLIVTSSLMLRRVEDCLNAVWQVKPANLGIGSFLRYWTILSLGPILIGVGVFLTSYVASIKILGSAVELLGVQGMLLTLFPFMLTVIAFALIYIAVPNCYVPIKSAFLGAFIAAGLFEVAKRIFAWYITKFPSYELIYGAFAALPIFLVWINLCWVIFLAGGVVSRTFAVDILRSTKLPDLYAGIEILKLFHQAQQSGKSLNEDEIYKSLSWLNRYQWDRIRVLFEGHGLMAKTDKDSFLLTKSLEKVNQFEVLQILGWINPQGQINQLPPEDYKSSLLVYQQIKNIESKLKSESLGETLLMWFQEDEKNHLSATLKS